MSGLSAITFITADMGRSVAFWQAAGFDTAYGGTDASFTSFRAGGNTFINLAENHEPQQSPPPETEASLWGRMIIHVASPDDTYAALVAAGYEPHARPADAPWGERYFHVTDPDGNEISFACPLAGSAEAGIAG